MTSNTNVIVHLDQARMANKVLQMAANSVAITNTLIQRLINMINRNIDQALCTIQSAQNQQLSLDFLDKDQLRALHNKRILIYGTTLSYPDH